MYANLAVLKLAWFGLGICGLGSLYFVTLCLRNSVRKSVREVNERKGS